MMSQIVTMIAGAMMPRRKNKPEGSCPALRALLYDFETEFFDDGIGEDFLGDALGLRLSVLTGEAVEIEDEEFALADVFDGVVAESGEGVLDGLTLRIENGALWHDPNVCFHAKNYSTAAERARCLDANAKFEWLRSFGHLRGCPQDDNNSSLAVGVEIECKGVGEARLEE